MLATELRNPSFIVVHPSRQVLYSVEELQHSENNEPTGRIKIYEIGADSALTLVHDTPSYGQDPCYLSLTPTASHLMCANYTSGTISLFKLDKTGRIEQGAKPLVVQLHMAEKSDNPRQECSHAHCIQYLASLESVVVSDLGGDCLLMFKLASDGNSIQ